MDATARTPGGGSTENSDDEGTEYREVNAGGDRAAWSLGRGTHSISGTARVTHLPEGDPEVTIAQLHDDETDRLSIAAQVVKGETALVMKVNGSSKGLPRLDTTYETGDAFDVELEIVGGAPRVHLDGDLVYEGKPGDIKGSDENYWKAGPYAQATEESGGEGEYAEVELRDLSITHESAGAPAAPRETPEEKAPAKAEAEREAKTPQQTRPTTTPSAVKETAETKPARKQAPDGAEVALADEPVMLLTGDEDGTAMTDVVDPDREVTAHGKSAPATTPDGGAGVDLDGSSGYLQVDGKDLSIAGTGQLSVEILMRPDKTRDLTATEASSEGPMVHVLNKGSKFGGDGDQEWATRVYDEDSKRPGRVSGYAFRPEGGEGAGSYDQSGLEPGQWVVTTAVYDTTTKGEDGWGTVTMYRDGQEVDADSLGDTYQVEPEDGGSPLYVGGGAGDGRFDGAIGAVAIYPTAQSDEQIAARAAVALAK